MRQAAAAVTVGTYWPWEPTATLRSEGVVGSAARGASVPRGKRGAGAYCGGRPPTACLSLNAAAHTDNNNNNAIYIAQIPTQQQMGCRMVSVQTKRLSA